jgi:hypothetical protein
MSKKKDKFYYNDGTTSDEWNISKILHRVDGPAVEFASGGREWWIDGRLHRIDGPAIEWANGTKGWYVDGKRHRIDGPAAEYADGGREWYVDDKLHRVDGPAMEWADGEKIWWIDDEEYTKKQFNKLIKQVNEMSTSMKLTDPRWWVRELGENEVKLVG